MRLGQVLKLALSVCAFFSGTAKADAASLIMEPLPLIWAAPFIGMLLSIALLPLAAPTFWHKHFGKVSAFWTLIFLLPFSLAFNFSIAAEITLRTLLAEFIPFIIVMIALYTISGGIYLQGNLHGSAGLNTAFLGLGSLLASLIGTTGASTMLIRPLLRANDTRRHNIHVVVFFIFLVSNIGGALTPLGDPPLFLGFLKGVPFFWPTFHLLLPMLLCLSLLLPAFYALDSYYFYRERHERGRKRRDKTPDTNQLRVFGLINFVLMMGVIAAMLVTPHLNLGHIRIFGTHISVNTIWRDVILLGLAGLSLKLTPRLAREGNEFDWRPLVEVMKLFIAIFLTAVPVIAILQQGNAGALGWLTQLATQQSGTPNNFLYFWLTGVLSAFLDNAPTYLVFFEMAGGNPQILTTDLNQTLLSISCGAVFMGALTYIGNAPNFMVRSIAISHGVKMPSFFGYMAWSCLFLLPVFVLLSVVFFSG